MLPSQHKEDIARNRYIVKEIIDALIFCCRQNIAIFASCVQTRQNTRFSPEYPSTEFDDKINISRYAGQDNRLAMKWYVNKIVRAYNDSEYFSLIGDEATDVSRHEQVFVCVMFVECTVCKVILREEFLDFVRASETTSEHLAKLF